MRTGSDEAPLRPGGLARRTSPTSTFSIIAVVASALVLLGVDRLPRFYQGDSISYLTTGVGGWIPPDRSWIYGFGSQFLVAATRFGGALPVAQALLLVGAVLLAARTFEASTVSRRGALVFALVAVVDPLNETYSRFWLSDAPAAAAFVGFVALLARAIDAPTRRPYLLLAMLAACVVVSVFVRVAYAPIEVGMLVIAAVAASRMPPRDRRPRLRRTLLALTLLPILAVGALGLANSRVAISALKGHFFVNGMADLYTMGVFLPALRHEDFARAGVTFTQAEFDDLDLERYDAREAQIWVDGPHYVRWLMQRKLGSPEVYDPHFQAICAAVVRSALTHHPQTLAFVYLHSLALYFVPAEWTSGFDTEMGWNQPLPDWAARYLAGLVGSPVPPTVTALRTPLPTVLGHVVGVYPLLLLSGAVAAGFVLLRVRPFGSRHLVAAAVVSALAVTPLFSHAVKPRYVLATVTLSELLLALMVFNGAALAVLRAPRRAARLGRLVATPALPACAAALCIAAYAGQLALGRWQTDEFTLFANQQEYGWHVLAPRLAYAPRPFSEALLYLYGRAVLVAREPLTVPFLAVMWTGVLVAGALAARSVLSGPGSRAWGAVALVGAVFAFVLTTTSVTEVFYWPAAAVAYLPPVASAVVLMFLLSRPLDGWRRLGCGAALLVAATSSEMGAALATGFAAAAVVTAFPIRTARPLRGVRRMAAREVWWIFPGIAGVLALALVLLLRANIVELGSDAQPYTGRAAASVGMALRELALELAGGDGTGGNALSVACALATRLLFALAFALMWRSLDRDPVAPGRWHAVLAASLAACAFFSLTAGYYHYGTLCCERHATTRLWMIDLIAILGMRWLLSGWRPLAGLNVSTGAGQRFAWVPPALLTLSLFPILLRLDGLWLDYDNQHLAVEASRRTWRSGLRGDSDSMQFYLPPDHTGMLIRGTFLPLGSFQAAGASPPMISEIGRFFGKRTVTVCQPWQNEKSWLIDGNFIPSCPPHDGPPDVVVASH